MKSDKNQDISLGLTSPADPPEVKAGEILPSILKRMLFLPATPFWVSDALTDSELPFASIFVSSIGMSPEIIQITHFYEVFLNNFFIACVI
jgi:hypothetical protein